MKNLYILVGEGIECEKETKRFFSYLPFELSEVPVTQLLQDQGKRFFSELKKGDWIFLPGGFSFADHLGSGKLLTFYLNKLDFFNRLKNAGVTVLGICNGFQVLAAAEIFGENVSLEHNQGGQGFINRWIYCKSPFISEKLKLCVRHGEGRLNIEGTLHSHVQPVLYYDDENYNNGSVDKVAGLMATFTSGTRFMGFMPHPEIGLRKIDEPDAVPGDYWTEQKEKLLAPTGDGMKFIKALIGEFNL